MVHLGNDSNRTGWRLVVRRWFRGRWKKHIQKILRKEGVNKFLRFWRRKFLIQGETVNKIMKTCTHWSTAPRWNMWGGRLRTATFKWGGSNASFEEFPPVRVSTSRVSTSNLVNTVTVKNAKFIGYITDELPTLRTPRSDYEAWCGPMDSYKVNPTTAPYITYRKDRFDFVSFAGASYCFQTRHLPSIPLLLVPDTTLRVWRWSKTF